MKYLNSEIRRQDRLLHEKRAMELLSRGEYGILSMAGENEGGYGVPLSFVWDNKSSIYFHCAKEGKKLCLIDRNPHVSFCVVGNTKVLSSRFTTEYESIVLECTAKRKLSDEECIEAVKLILDKYCPKDKTIGIKYAQKSFSRTEIVKLDIDVWSGKCKKVPGK